MNIHTGTLEAKKNSLTNKDLGNHTMSETVKVNNKHNSSVKEDTDFYNNEFLDLMAFSSNSNKASATVPLKRDEILALGAAPLAG